MSAESAIYDVLSADATLLALATGGVHVFDTSLGPEGLNRSNYPAAFASDGTIKPCIMITSRAANPGFNVPDDDGQVMDVRQVVECYLFEFSGYATIESMEGRCYALLHAKRLDGAYRVDWAGSGRLGRDLEIDANVTRVDWLCVWVRSV
jgi:hypothetical protein